MPLNNECPSSTSSGDEQGSDGESSLSSSRRCDSTASASDTDCSRESFTSDGSSKHCTPSSSPPKTLSLDEIMDSARGISNLNLFHEIVVNRDFHLEPHSLPEDSLWKVVSDNVHKAFWDILESELNDDPPEYQQAIHLLDEIREILLSFLNPGANRMRTQILEVLDMDLIRQQVDNDAVDVAGLAAYIIDVMGKMCAPVRDEEIKKLRESTGSTVMLFREIFHVLELMKIDFVNLTIDSLRPVMQKQSVEYERATFQSILDKTPDALNNTTAWIKMTFEELLSTMPSNQEKGQLCLPGPFQVLNAAFLHILLWDYTKHPLPETWMTDEGRLREVQVQLRQWQAVNEVLLIVQSTVGGPVQGVAALSERLKRMTAVLLDHMHNPTFNLQEALVGVSAQICSELNKSLAERSYPTLTPSLQATLTGQICSIAHQDNPIRTLVEDRVQHYFMTLICDRKPENRLEQTPAGLSAIRLELASLAAKFLSLVNYNRAVYGPFYADIIRKLMFSNTSPSPLPDSTPQDSLTSE
ncbi:T-complex protein 11-like protein 2 [Corythoichthys intestinalis]|uniref:T-complex protein 11-like protein 2 n=1 Tax=Corythoichthys intestinalis TaxID=161448 RepID=UPI0025A58E64|nr:T-complex protein 11-like protein 2 [Corythoichthys intestinalis]XP_061809693.1 T-complex protein 11-like protein 2 [Nerophis lumbriciformis]